MDLDIITGELRASVRRWRVPGIRSGRGGHADGLLDGGCGPDLMLLLSGYDVARAPFTSHRPFIGRLIIMIKNVARELLVQLFDRQSSYNAAAARVLSRLDRKLDQIARQQERLERRLDALEALVTSESGSALRLAPAAGGAPDKAIDQSSVRNGPVDRF
jgi:hypothetical protein